MSSHRFVRREQRDPGATDPSAASVKRYWPGRAPHWVDDAGDKASAQANLGEDESAFAQAFREDVRASTTGVAPPVVVRKVCVCVGRGGGRL